MYRSHSPAQSSTSSDGEDEDFNKSTLFPSDPVAATPAQWSRMQLIPHPTSHTRQIPLPSFASRIPPEILIHILKHLHSSRDLYHALLVSRLWCECSVELLWHRPGFSKLSTLGKMMRVLAREDQTFIYARFIRRLNFLYLGGDLTDSLFSRLASCVRLERLTLINCSSLSDGALARVLPCCPNLVALDLTNVGETTDRAIIALASSTKRLQGINLGGCKKLTDKGVLALAANCPLLRRVKLSHVEQITDEAISALAKSCPLLLEIDINNCKRVTDVSIRDLWTYSLHMREMRLSHCVELTDAAFPASPKSDALAERVNPFPSSAQNGDGLPPLRLSRSFEHLRMLDLTGCSLISDEAVEGIISVAPKLRNLVLAKCSLLTDTAVEAICSLGKHLHYLHLGHAGSITDRSIRSVARACTRLRYIDLANCTQLTDMSVFELASLQKLRRIGLVRVSNLTDHAIYSLGERYGTLERIHLSYCDQITVMAIHFLLQKLPKLTHLSLTGIPAFRRPELQQFCREPPQEFNTAQRAAFCVYSGKGVQDLRDFLNDLFNTITDEIAADSSTEYDDDFEDEYQGRHDLTDDMQLVNEGDDEREDDDDSPTPAHPANGHTYSNAVAPVQFPPMPITRDLFMARDRGHQPHTRPATTALSGSRHGPSPRRVRGFGQQPIVETSTSPTPSDVASNRSAGTNSNGAGWFRNYVVETNGTLRQGVLTPDLVFAEIGHGRGAGHFAGSVPGPSSVFIPQGRRSIDILPPHTPPVHDAMTFVDAATSLQSSREYPTPRPERPAAAMQVLEDSTTSVPSSSGDEQGRNRGTKFDQNGLRTDGNYHSPGSDISQDWTTIPPDRSLSPTSRGPQESVHSVLGSHPAYREQHAAEQTGREVDDRGRSVKRSLRNTFSAAEQYASSFFFGRGPSAGGDGAAPGGSGMRDGDAHGH
ncbi:hypothetical protein BXZ70DRAFT_1037208 [Cristinia sonorae]|uniref:F-box domain-containing protein n=1 Tax=Cristinia sonorae TaxID=1940300 RepID=A0A8K0XTK6_9AGAR|nr:hypothetical protein BXZ70DRAFT_1037208 [Cristinia sonorae]